VLLTNSGLLAVVVVFVASLPKNLKLKVLYVTISALKKASNLSFGKIDLSLAKIGLSFVENLSFLPT